MSAQNAATRGPATMQAEQQQQQQVVSAFFPAFREVQRMLFQNVLPRLEASPDYQDAYAQYIVTREAMA